MDAQTFLLCNIIENLGKQPVVEFKCGDCVGPYKVENDGESVTITLINYTGEALGLELEPNPVIRRIVASPSPLLANCVVLQTGGFVQILFTKDVMSNEALRAILVADMHYRAEKSRRDKEKKYECPKCHMAKFHSLQNLKVHEELYCSRREMEVSSSDEKSADPQKLIMLPLALSHRNPKMGRNRSTDPSSILNMNSMFVNEEGSISLELPPNSNDGHLEIAVKNPLMDGNATSVPSPLDLSSTSRAASVHDVSPNHSPTSKSSSNESFCADRPFLCSCGVSFSSEPTFEAHKQFYCKNSQSSSATAISRNDACRKVPEKCAQCDFVPVSSAQLAMHIRSVHQATKTFTCTVCGYRAFSMRGIRTHMRSHPAADSQKFKVNEPTVIRASSRP